MASMNEKDYYAILEVDKSATSDEIRKAFQQKARKLHPDVNKAPDAEDRFKELSEAYAVLSDADKRARYDAMRSGMPFASSGGYSGAAGGYGGYTSADPFGWGFPFGGMGYRRQAAQSSRSYNPRAGSDVAYELTLDDAAAEKGCQRGVTYTRYAPCEACGGAGSVDAAHETCPTCSGSGRIRVDLSDFFFGMVEMTCPECEGSGKVVSDPCSICGGSGRVESATELVVDIPARSHDGDVVRVEGMGHAGTNGEAAGDFVCRVNVPSEQLTPQARFGFHSIGVFLPFILAYTTFSNITNVVTSLVVALVALAVMGLSAGGLKRGRWWWRNALRAFASGVSTSLPWALFLFMLNSCQALMFTRRL